MKKLFLLVLLCQSVYSNAQVIKDLKKMEKESETNTYNYESMKTELAAFIDKFNTDLTYFEQNKSAWIRRTELRTTSTFLKAMQYNYITAAGTPYLVLEWDIFTPANVWMRNNIEKMLSEILDSSQYKTGECMNGFKPCKKMYFNQAKEKAFAIDYEKGNSLFFTLYKHGKGKELYTNKKSADSLNSLIMLENLVTIIEKYPNKDSFRLAAKYKAEICTGKNIDKGNQYIYTDCAKGNPLPKTGSTPKDEFLVFIAGNNLKSCTLIRTNLSTEPYILGSTTITGENAALLEKNNISLYQASIKFDINNLIGLVVLAEKVSDQAYILIYKKL